MTISAAIVLVWLILNFLCVLALLGTKKAGTYGAGDVLAALALAWLLYMGNFFAVTPVAPTHSVEKAP